MNDIKAYFENTDVFIEGNKYLRKPQRMAYRALKDSFENNPDTHKIVVLATGAGKTGVMAIAPFEISKGRVLIITPSLVIREGISDEFDTRTDYNFWTDKKVILDSNDLPKVYRYSGYKTTNDKKRIKRNLDESNIVIANIHKVYNNNSKKELIRLVDRDFFDMIIVDEAHHSEADSWKKTFEYFNCKKIIKLTATPYRSDEKELDGDIIYKYELADAIKEGIVKNIVSEDYTTQKLEFEVEGKLVEKEEALKMMDSNWLTRSVAYSEICSREIVEMSKQRLEEKRRLGGAHHQMIAVACSIDHAKQITDLYKEQGLECDYVSSDRQEESEHIIIEFKKGKLDVLVNVDMLSEGFDHPNISIAAIFRPFRTLSPYAQFIGRTLRKIQSNSINDNIDNIAHIVYHKELGLDDLWNYYTGQEELANRKKIIELDLRREFEPRNLDVGNVVSEGCTIKHIKTYLSDNIDSKYFEEIKAQIKRIDDELNETIKNMEKAGLSKEEIEGFKEFKKRQRDNEIDKKRNALREDLVREELREKYFSDVLDRIADLYDDVDMDPKGKELSDNTTNKFLKEVNNDAYILKYINQSVKKKLSRGIDEWETYDFEQAEKLIPELIQKLKEKYERACKNG